MNALITHHYKNTEHTFDYETAERCCRVKSLMALSVGCSVTKAELAQQYVEFVVCPVCNTPIETKPVTSSVIAYVSSKE